MKKLILAVAGTLAAGSAVAAVGMAASSADPASNSIYNVVGEPYAKAVAILRAQGIPASFGGSVGSDVPQSQCLVKSQKVLSTGKMQLMLDCTQAAQADTPATSVANSPGAQSTDGARPTAGAPGVVTVVPTRVG
ncbi:MAG: hypothetical protein ACR2JM_14925 [Mycobacterium sp.]